MVKFTQRGFECFCDALNHRMTRIETDVKWIRGIGYWMAGVLTTIAIKLIFFE